MADKTLDFIYRYSSDQVVWENIGIGTYVSMLREAEGPKFECRWWQ